MRVTCASSDSRVHILSVARSCRVSGVGEPSQSVREYTSCLGVCVGGSSVQVVNTDVFGGGGWRERRYIGHRPTQPVVLRLGNMTAACQVLLALPVVVIGDQLRWA